MRSVHFAAACVLSAGLMSSAVGGAADAAAAATSWATVNLNYAGDRYADLADINTKNAAGLGEACRVRVDNGGGFQSGLLLVDGLLYLTTRLATVALDPTDCSVVWKSLYTPEG